MVTRAAAEMNIDEAPLSEDLNAQALPAMSLEKDGKIYEVVFVPNEQTELPRPKIIPKHWQVGKWRTAKQHNFTWLDKINPRFWLGNEEDPEPPSWYRPQDAQRRTKWYFRNPGHNFTFYVIGVSDKVGTNDHRSYGIAPDDVFKEGGGWNVILHQVRVGKRGYVLLPFASYLDRNMKFYFGWRQSGNFGIKLTRNKERRLDL